MNVTITFDMYNWTFGFCLEGEMRGIALCFGPLVVYIETDEISQK